MLDVNLSRKIPEDFAKYGEQKIRELLNSVSGVDFVMLCSSDGFEIALANKKNVANSSKIAAVSSSILAMVTAFISEINLVGCQTITLDADNGKALLTAVPHAQYPMVLVSLTSKDILIGQMLYETKETVESLVKY
ncbi:MULTISPECIES: roadblock/LC7 domain-containing protein [Acinetobacter]|uniref:Roadblock/LC7 domain-containing protein n=1 Tax=Acinetobacter piscicola TaxID=2006115 RepID=A0A4Q4H0H3_9GAMM|nr:MULTISPECIES: roadblock/LC7 domain-containing protein [Acinetobacter]MDM1757563.1 roadblock/LC7 domain-containing protein [Acinetobacter sp. 256-1]MDM1761267.1 roadblock/LC7 domain-containing protein [Acinetobacter sp. 251-1]QOW46531.1 roadblock/LC7 domain-containing protein [Acinetobacter piscicola]RYL27697.1 roadblock/LC7 domain-containing protein [Acinetobacter piscicola]